MLMVCIAFFARVKPVSTSAKPGLHEHDQEARHEQPDEVDAEPVLVDQVGQLRGVRLGGLGRRVVALGDGPGREAVEMGTRPGRGPGRITRRRDGFAGARTAGDEEEGEDRKDDRRADPRSASLPGMVLPGPV